MKGEWERGGLVREVPVIEGERERARLSREVLAIEGVMEWRARQWRGRGRLMGR